MCLFVLSWYFEKQLSLFENTLDKTKFNHFSGLVIPEILNNINTCHGYARPPNSSVILSCHNALVKYSVPKGFYPVEKEDGTYKNIPLSVMKKINGVGIHEDDSTLKCQASIAYIVNILNKMSIP